MFKGCGGKLLIGFVWDRDFVLFADGTGCMEVMMETKQENQFGGFSLGWEILRCLFFFLESDCLELCFCFMVFSP